MTWCAPLPVTAPLLWGETHPRNPPASQYDIRGYGAALHGALESDGALDQPVPTLDAFPVCFYLLKEEEVTFLWSCLERLTMLLLE